MTLKKQRLILHTKGNTNLFLHISNILNYLDWANYDYLKYNKIVCSIWIVIKNLKVRAKLHIYCQSTIFLPSLYYDQVILKKQPYLAIRVEIFC